MIELHFSGDVHTVKAEMRAMLEFMSLPAAPFVGRPTDDKQSDAPTEKPMTTAQKKVAEKATKATKATKAAAEAAVQQQAISTGEERVGPQDTPADEKQDAADEAADKKPATKLDHDSVRSALGEYVKKFGMPAAQEDGPKCLALVFKGKEIDKVSLIPDTQEDLQKAFKREAI
jgi:cell division septation protein DedD